LTSERKKMADEVQSNPWITLIGGDRLVPHLAILEAIQNSDAGILSYRPSHHTVNSHPTKLFEYLHAGLPVILEKHWPWIDQFTSCKPFIVYDVARPDYPALLEALLNETFYVHPPANVTWHSEEPRLLQVMENAGKRG